MSSLSLLFCFSFLFFYDLGLNVRLLSATLDTVTSPHPSLTSVPNEVLWRRLILLRLRSGFRGNYPSTGCSSQIWTLELFIKNHTVSGGGWHVLRCGAKKGSNFLSRKETATYCAGGLLHLEETRTWKFINEGDLTAASSPSTGAAAAAAAVADADQQSALRRRPRCSLQLWHAGAAHTS